MTKKIVFYLLVMLPLLWQCGGKGNNNPEPQKPTITSIDPSSGTVGTTVTITGTNFSTTPANNVVKFNGTDATVSAATTTSLTVTVPQGATTGKITVSVSGQTATSNGDFTVTVPSPNAPTITSFSPLSGNFNTTVTITGTNFSTDPLGNVVRFNGEPATVTAASTTSLTVTIPKTSPGKITVSVGGQTATSASDFQVTNYWVKKADFTSFRNNAVGFSIGNKGYAGLGQDNGTYKKDFWEYDPSSNTWTQKADFGGSARREANSFVSDTKGYVGAGYNGSNLSDMWEYDPATNTWTQKANYPIAPLFTFRIDNKAYTMNGNRVFYEYDITTNTWRQRQNVPTVSSNQRALTFGFAANGKGYMGGGLIWAGPGQQGATDFYEFNPATNAWTQKANSPGYNHASYTLTIGTKVYCGLSPGGTLFNLYVYDTVANTWSELPWANEFISAFSFVINGKGYVGTGQSGATAAYTKSFMEFNP